MTGKDWDPQLGNGVTVSRTASHIDSRVCPRWSGAHRATLCCSTCRIRDVFCPPHPPNLSPQPENWGTGAGWGNQEEQIYTDAKTNLDVGELLGLCLLCLASRVLFGRTAWQCNAVRSVGERGRAWPWQAVCGQLATCWHPSPTTRNTSAPPCCALPLVQ